MEKIKQLTDTLSNFRQDIFKSFDYGEQPDTNEFGNDNYPLLYLEEPILGTINNDKLVLEFAILLLKQDTEQGYKQHTQWIDEAINLVPELKRYLENVQYTVESIDFITLRGYGSDLSSGIRINLTLNTNRKC